MVYFFVIAVSFITTFLTTPTIRYAGLRFYAIDKRNARKVHNKVITKLGGIAIYFGFITGLIILVFLEFKTFNIYKINIGGLVLCSTLMLIFGIYDDFQNSGPALKLIVQIIVALLLTRLGFTLERIFIPGLIDISLGKFSVPFTVLWIVGITNAVNLTDGLDGLAAGLAGIVYLFLCVNAFLLKDYLVLYASLSILGATIAFLKYNFYPSKIFMGDTGSLFLGFTIASLGVHRYYRVEGLINPFFPITVIILLLPITDIILAIVRRVKRRQNIFSGDSCHMHHYYMKLGFNQVNTVLRFYIMTFSLGLASLLITFAYFH